MIWPSLLHLQMGSLRPRELEDVHPDVQPTGGNRSLEGLSEPFMISPSTKVYYYFRLISIFPFSSFHVLKEGIFSEMLKLHPGTIELPFKK